MCLRVLWIQKKNEEMICVLIMNEDQIVDCRPLLECILQSLDVQRTTDRSMLQSLFVHVHFVEISRIQNPK
jgi:two-component SAPR family response regulator